MEHNCQLCLFPREYPSLPRVIETPQAAQSIGLISSDAHVKCESAPFALSVIDFETRHRIADALTAIMVQAEATRRNALRLDADGFDVTASSERIIACAKLVWQLIADQQDQSELHSVKNDMDDINP